MNAPTTHAARGDPPRFGQSSEHKTNRQRGQSMVELVVILPLILILVLGSIELSRAFVLWAQLSSATSEGARRAIVSGGDPNPAGAVDDAVRKAAPTLESGKLTVASVSTWTAGDDVTVSTSYAFTSQLMGILPLSTTLHSHRTMVMES